MCFLSRILKYQYVIHIFPFFPMSGIMETCGNKAPISPEPSVTLIGRKHLQIYNDYVACVKSKTFVFKSLRLLFYLLL